MKTSLSILLIVFLSCAQSESTKNAKDDLKSESTIGDTTQVDTSKPSQIDDIDTVTINSFSLEFQPSDSVSLSEVFGDDSLRNQMVDSLPNTHESAVTIERYLSQQFGAYFEANDSLLVLTLEGNNRLSFPRKWDENRVDEAGQVVYSFAHYYASIDYFLLHEQWYEGDGYVLVNRKNGYKLFIIGLPYISPTQNRILIINSDLEAGYTTNGIQMLSVSGDTLRTDFSLEIANWEPTGAKWLSDEELLLEKSFLSTSDNESLWPKKYTRLTIK